MWLLHGADDVVFAGQQKVIFVFRFILFFDLVSEKKSAENIC